MTEISFLDKLSLKPQIVLSLQKNVFNHPNVGTFISTVKVSQISQSRL